MQREEIREIFDQQAATYDQQWQKTAALNKALHLLMGAVFAELPEDAHLLCVGAGTGAELLYLAERFPRWRFTLVDPSSGMLEVCRHRAREQGIAERCTFHQGYVESLPATETFDGATALLVSQFILAPQARSEFFRDIARRLHSGGILVSSDLSADIHSEEYHGLLEMWLRMMQAAEVTPEAVERMRTAYARDVAVLPAGEVEEIIGAGGFGAPVQFYQAGLIRGWYSRRKPSVS
ncbi:class I SAM-dependent methyltransferase [Microbulbifer sp. SAOS-129_SWC]|uniref:class I SAM-dependent methyltransferase n=1 Tax=Microbulbifer sp. SAOS-129_SWC TaxID=3145235 RepID=UPI003216E207